MKKSKFKKLLKVGRDRSHRNISQIDLSDLDLCNFLYNREKR